MSHPHIVPQGWERGEPLDWWQVGERFAARQARPPLFDAKISGDDIAYITFDTREDLTGFLAWWFEGKSAAQVKGEADEALIDRKAFQEIFHP